MAPLSTAPTSPTARWTNAMSSSSVVSNAWAGALVSVVVVIAGRILRVFV
jgi:hypothetical protein